MPPFYNDREAWDGVAAGATLYSEDLVGKGKEKETPEKKKKKKGSKKRNAESN